MMLDLEQVLYTAEICLAELNHVTDEPSLHIRSTQVRALATALVIHINKELLAMQPKKKKRAVK